MSVNLSLLSGQVVVFDSMTLTVTIFIKIRVSSSIRVDILWDGSVFPFHLLIFDYNQSSIETS